MIALNGFRRVSRMLLIKCPQCQASYRLAESLYRRKAAGYGVVITCRRCKTQIHIDEGSLPPPAGTADQSAPETPDDDVVARTAADADQEPVTPTRALRTTGTPTPSLTTAHIGLPPADPSHPDDDTTDAAVTALPNVVPKPAPPRPLGGIPRPGSTAPRPGAAAPRPSAAAPRRQGTLLGIAPPTHALTPAPTVAPKPRVPPTPDDNWKPKLVALSPGLLGVQTATHGAPPGAKAPPAPPHLHHPPPPPPPPPPPVPDEDAAPDSAVPLSAGSVELLDSTLDSKPPDSVVPLDSADYLSAPQTAPPAPPPVPELEEDEKTIVRNPVEETPLAVRAKRMPQPPPARPVDPDVARPAGPDVKTPEVNTNEKPRRRQASGDLSDDFLSSDLSFDARASAPALAPPDAGALTRAPVSTRPAAAQAGTATPSTKAPLSKSAAGEKKGSGRGIAILLVIAAFGSAGYALTHRAMTPEAPRPEPTAAVNAPAPEPPPAALAETAAPAPTETVASAPPSAAAPEPPVAVATPPSTGTSHTTTPSPAPVAASPGTPKTTKTSAERPAPAPAETAEKAASTPTAKPTATAAPTSTAAIEPRGAAGTEPFDVAAARSALDASAAQASGCRKEGDPSGVAVVTITFSQTGRVTTANISGPPFQATPTGGCIASTMRKTRVPAFAGEMVTVRKTITVQ